MLCISMRKNTFYRWLIDNGIHLHPGVSIVEQDSSIAVFSTKAIQQCERRAYSPLTSLVPDSSRLYSCNHTEGRGVVRQDMRSLATHLLGPVRTWRHTRVIIGAVLGNVSTSVTFTLTLL